MCIRILSFRGEERHCPEGLPLIDVELIFRIEGQGPKVEALRAEVKKYAQGYRLSLAIDDLEPYLEWLNSDALLDFKSVYHGVKKTWVFTDQEFQYLNDLDAFMFSDCVASSPVTKAAIEELKYYQEHGKLSSWYNHEDSYVVLSLILTLSKFWF